MSETIATFTGPVAFYDTPTSDGRLIVAGALTARDLPLPFMLQTVTAPGHDGAELAGRITALDLLTLTAVVELDDSDAGERAVAALRGGSIGVSIDIADIRSDVEVTETDEEGNPTAVQETMTQGEIMGATGTPFPAFAGARLTEVVDAVPTEAEPVEPENEAEVEETMALADEMPMEPEVEAPELNPVVSESEPTTEPIEPGAVLQLLVDEEGEPSAVLVSAEGELVLTAAGAPLAAPASFFTRPAELDEGPVQSINITPEGRIFGYVALWGTCHVGFQDRCITPPTSMSSYQHFQLGTYQVAEGYEIPVGLVTMDTRHYDDGRELYATAAETRAHYDNSGLQAAAVVTGEDERGIWYSGALYSHLTEADVQRLRNTRISGDWRKVAGSLELVAALAVNMPGFPVPHLGVSHDRQVSLVAAGAVRDPQPESTTDELAAAVRELAREQRLARLRAERAELDARFARLTN